MTTVVLDPQLGIAKEALVPRMRGRGIDVRPFFYPLSMIPAFRDTPEAARARSGNEVAQCVSPYGINLPSALNLDRVSVEQVCSELRQAIGDLKS
jgi:perosamine synthetase